MTEREDIVREPEGNIYLLSFCRPPVIRHRIRPPDIPRFRPRSFSNPFPTCIFKDSHFCEKPHSHFCEWQDNGQKTEYRGRIAHAGQFVWYNVPSLAKVHTHDTET